MRRLAITFLLVLGLLSVSTAHERVFFSVGLNFGVPHYCPDRVVYVERPVIYRPYYYPPPVYYAPVERVIIIHKHKHWKHWRDWDD
ncbi:hypothetical protein HRbin13_01274 [bacterium HR13]|mgnify:FL=1|nr:hypothetical protein HRbin13_01274 [bacterium HR13]